jgi:uncharacterized damage-inducible protein DinB
MTFADHCRLMARYNAWMNGKLIVAAETLPAEALTADRGAFFSSILGTFNHLLVTDLMWMHRIRSHPKAAGLDPTVMVRQTPTRLDQTLHTSLAALKADRLEVDAVIATFAERLDGEDFDMALTYRRANGEAQRKTLSAILAHLFNHQTHHRGQITTLLFQAGVDPGVTDLNALTPSLL